MNVIISNTRKDELTNLNIDVIKSINGQFSADEIVSMFKDFFYSKMILDITSIQDYLDSSNIQKISLGLDSNKIILLLPEDNDVSSSLFISKIISMGIYNFTTNIDGVKYLLEHPNKYKDVANIQNLDIVESSMTIENKTSFTTKIIGVQNLTEHAGATTLIYMMKKELEKVYGETIYAIEVDKHEFSYFNDKNMISTTASELNKTIRNLKNPKYVFIDLDEEGDSTVCGDVIYLLEPSIIKLNKLLKRKSHFATDLAGKKIVLNKSLLNNKDLNEFEYESKLSIFYNLVPLNDRIENETIKNLLYKLNLMDNTNVKSSKGLFNIFKR